MDGGGNHLERPSRRATSPPVLRRAQCGMIPGLDKLTILVGGNYIYLVGDSDGQASKVLRIDRAEGDKLRFRHEQRRSNEAYQLMEKIKRVEQPELILPVFCICGFIKIIESYYLWVCLSAKKVGVIRGHYIWMAERGLLIRVANGKASADELRYRAFLAPLFEAPRDLFYSLTYDLTNTLQTNTMAVTQRSPELQANDMFLWNASLLRPLVRWLQSKEAQREQAQLEDWVVPFVHGFFRQRAVQLSSGQVMRITLIGRRSRHFAGTRFLRRGVNKNGAVANEVHTEQIVCLDPCLLSAAAPYSACVQVRGSIPLFWSHPNILAPKPEIEIREKDPMFTATTKHFDRLFHQYGHKITVLNLVRQTDSSSGQRREGYLSAYFSEAIAFLNDQLLQRRAASRAVGDGESSYDAADVEGEHDDLAFISYDFLGEQKKSEDKSIPLIALMQIADAIAPRVGLFADSGQGAKSQIRLQEGILRSNCVDCLDRTNIAQFSMAKVMFERQVAQLGIRLSSQALSEVGRVLMTMWAEHGDTIAQQYGGSGAMHRVDEDAGKGGERDYKLTGGAKNALVAVRRYYSNAVQDFEKQQMMDLFLGVAVPQKGGMPGGWILWKGTEAEVSPSSPGMPTPTVATAEPLEALGDKALVALQEEVSAAEEAEGETELLLSRRVTLGAWPGVMLGDDAHRTVELSELDAMRALDFNVPVLQALDFDVLTSTDGRQAAELAAQPTTIRSQEMLGERCSTAAVPHEQPKRKTIQEELYERYCSFEVLIRNGVAARESNTLAYATYPDRAVDSLKEYVRLSGDLELIMRLMQDPLSESMLRHHRVKRPHSFDDLASLRPEMSVQVQRAAVARTGQPQSTAKGLEDRLQRFHQNQSQLRHTMTSFAGAASAADDGIQAPVMPAMSVETPILSTRVPTEMSSPWVERMGMGLGTGLWKRFSPAGPHHQQRPQQQQPPAPPPSSNQPTSVSRSPTTAATPPIGGGPNQTVDIDADTAAIAPGGRGAMTSEDVVHIGVKAALAEVESRHAVDRVLLQDALDLLNRQQEALQAIMTQLGVQ